MARIYGCHVTSREAMLFMKYEQMANVKVHLRTRRGNVNIAPYHTAIIKMWFNICIVKKKSMINGYICSYFAQKPKIR